MRIKIRPNANEVAYIKYICHFFSNLATTTTLFYWQLLVPMRSAERSRLSGTENERLWPDRLLTSSQTRHYTSYSRCIDRPTVVNITLRPSLLPVALSEDHAGSIRYRLARSLIGNNAYRVQIPSRSWIVISEGGGGAPRQHLCVKQRCDCCGLETDRNRFR